jgi:hypothetical protein
MYEKTYGAKYDSALSVPEIAKRFRQDVKEAIGRKVPEGLPKGLKLSVRSDHNSISVRVVACPGLVVLNLARLCQERDNPHTWCQNPEPIHPEAAAELLKTLKAMLNAYNYDGSDLQSDYFNVNFYENIGFDGALERAERDAFAKGGTVAVLDQAEHARCMHTFGGHRCELPFAHGGRHKISVAAEQVYAPRIVG